MFRGFIVDTLSLTLYVDITWFVKTNFSNERVRFCFLFLFFILRKKGPKVKEKVKTNRPLLIGVFIPFDREENILGRIGG